VFTYGVKTVFLIFIIATLNDDDDDDDNNNIYLLTYLLHGAESFLRS